MSGLPGRVLFVSSSYPQNTKDWKSVFIQQLLRALATQQETNVCYWGPPGDIPEDVTYLCTPTEKKWLLQLMEKGGIIHLIRQGGRDRVVAPLQFLYYLMRMYGRSDDVDIIHVNWLQNALPLLKKGAPLVISVLGSDLGLLKVPGMTFLLRVLLKRRSCYLAPNAEWMVAPLKDKFGDLCSIRCIPLGIDDHWYQIKRDYNPQEPKKWVVISRITEAKIGSLFEWGQQLFQNTKSHELHLFGPMQEELSLPDWVHYHGSTYPEELKNDWFPHVSGLITLSRHDEGRPQVMLEAMASGVPIIASDLTAHKNFITHEETGYLVSNRDEFYTGIEWVMDVDNNQYLSRRAKDWVALEIGNWLDCAQRYLNIYSQLLQGKG